MDNFVYDVAFNLGYSLFCAMVSKINTKIHDVNYPEKLGQVSNEIFGKYVGSDLDTVEFEQYVVSSEFRKIVNVYYTCLYHNQEGETPEEELHRLISHKFPTIPEALIKDFVENIKICYERMLKEIIEQDEGSSQYASVQLQVAMNKTILNEIIKNRASIKDLVEMIKKQSEVISDEDIEVYHKNCESIYGKIRFTGIVGAERTPLQDIEKYYVKNDFIKLKEHKIEFGTNNREQPCDLHGIDSFFDESNRIVIIGKAGYGKSTTINYIYCKFEDIFKERLFKIKIDLKDYAKQISEDKSEILECLAKEVQNKIKSHELNLNDIKSKIGENFEQGKGLVIFDALDEITTKKAREDVREAITSFCNVYPLSKYIITSREVGYLSNDFDDDFLHFRICEFSQEKIDEYINNWLNIHGFSEKDKQEFVKNFEEAVENANCQELIKSPIILVLSLIIFNIENNLPKNRISFYEKCIRTFLFEREDSKNTIEQPIKDFVTDENLLPTVAFYRFEKTLKEMDYIFTKQELRNAILVGTGIEKSQEHFVKGSLDDYIKYLVNRTELIIEQDDNIYGFSHKSFYDYFIAKYHSIHFEFEDSNEIENIILKRLGDSNYDELARLIIEELKMNNPAKYKRVMDYLFQYLGLKNYTNTYNEAERLDKVYNISELLKYLNFTEMFTKKSQIDFYRFVIRNPTIFYRNYSKLEIDNSEMVMYFKEVYDKEGIEDVVDSLFYLSQNFSSEVVKNYNFDKLIVKLHELVKYCQNNEVLQWKFNVIKKSSSTSDKVEQLIDYFLKEQSELVQKSSLLYLIILSVLIKNKMNILTRMPEIKFLSNNSLYRYTKSEIIFQFVVSCQQNIKAEEYLGSLLKRAIANNYVDFFATMKRKKIVDLRRRQNQSSLEPRRTLEFQKFEQYCDRFKDSL